jgi:hypothetical protein
MPFATYTFQNGTTLPVFPTSPAPVSWEIKHKRSALVSDARSHRRVTRRVGGERIEMTVRFPPMKTADCASAADFKPVNYVGHSFASSAAPHG